jgi:thiamine biosynthesis lipoprotein
MKKIAILVLLLSNTISFGQQIFKKKQSLLGSPFEITVVATDSIQGNQFTDIAIGEVKRIEN